MSNNNSDKTIFDVLKSQIRFRIFSLLHLYPELSLSDLSIKMGKSKSTIHHHLKELIDSGLIEVSRKEKVRGSILAKFYSLKPGYIKKLSEKRSKSDDLRTIEFFKTYLNFAIRTLELYKSFFEIIEQKEDWNIELKDLLGQDKGFSSLTFFSEEQFKKVVALNKEYIQKIDEIEKEENGVKKEKPYYFFTIALPLKHIIEEMTTISQ
jgi:DNA-binding transcriptional ArsR family regulator